MEMIYSLNDLAIAKSVIKSSNKTCRVTGNPLFSIENLMWAQGVLIWFAKLWGNIRRACKSFKLSWCMATKFVWGRLKLGLEWIKPRP
jgi:hypothetical protein